MLKTMTNLERLQKSKKELEEKISQALSNMSRLQRQGNHYEYDRIYANYVRIYDNMVVVEEQIWIAERMGA